MDVPTEADWRNEPWCLDAAVAYEHFHGKTTAEAVQLFEQNALYYQEDVLFMPSRAFGYYARAYAEYLMSEAAQGDSDGASAFISLLKFKAQWKPEDVRPIWPELRPLLERLANEQDRFDAIPEIYGDFRTRIQTLAAFGFSF
jgi:hypothetical protein